MVPFTSDENDSYYALLGVPHDATREEIKRAYRLTLLRCHPDKSRKAPQSSPDHSDTSESSSSTPRLDAALLKEAYHTLVDAELRAEYDVQLANARLQFYDYEDYEDDYEYEYEYDEADDLARRRANQTFQQSRPAQLVSLDEFEEANDHLEEAWTYPCRCGDRFRITVAQMEEDFHLVSCPGCSEVIWVGYEAIEEAETDEESSVEGAEEDDEAGDFGFMQ